MKLVNLMFFFENIKLVNLMFIYTAVLNLLTNPVIALTSVGTFRKIKQFKYLYYDLRILEMDSGLTISLYATVCET